MELQDCAFPTLAGIVATDKVEEAFKDVDYVFLVGSFPRKAGMDRSDLLAKNGGIFTVQGKALSDYAKPTVKVIVVGNPANTNCQIAYASAPNLKKENWCAMTRLDHNRMLGEIAARLNTTADHIHGLPFVFRQAFGRIGIRLDDFDIRNVDAGICVAHILTIPVILIKTLFKV